MNKKTIDDFPREEGEGEISSQEPQPQLESITTNKSKRIIRKHTQLVDKMTFTDLIIDDSLPTTYKVVVQSS